MRVLVTGSTGFLGNHVVAALRARGHEVIGVARSLPAPRATCVPGAVRATEAARVPGALPTHHDLRRIDLSVPDAIEALLREVRPDGVIHLAALADIAPCREQPALARRLNAEVPAEIARWCAASAGEAPVQGAVPVQREAPTRGATPVAARLVHVSTDQVFDGSRGGWRETDATSPLHEYGATKLAGERAVLSACASAAVLRPSLITGRAAPGQRSATSALVELLARGERPRMFTDEIRTPVAVEDVARSLADLLGRPGASGVFHCGGPVVLTRHELARREARAAGFDPALVTPVTRAELGLASKRPADLSLDSRRLAELLGWSPRAPVPEA